MCSCSDNDIDSICPSVLVIYNVVYKLFRYATSCYQLSGVFQPLNQYNIIDYHLVLFL